MNCAACNAELKPGAATCLECGAAVAAAAPAAPKERLFGDWVNLAVRILKMEESAIHEVARDENATTMAFVFLAIAGAAPALGSLTIVTLFLSIPMMLIGNLIGVGITHLIATMLGGKGQYWELFRVQGLASMISWVNAIPILGMFLAMLAMLYNLAVTVHNVKVVHKLPLGHAIAVVVLPAVLVLGFCIAAAVALGGMVAVLSSHH